VPSAAEGPTTQAAVEGTTTPAAAPAAVAAAVAAAAISTQAVAEAPTLVSAAGAATLAESEDGVKAPTGPTAVAVTKAQVAAGGVAVRPQAAAGGAEASGDEMQQAVGVGTSVGHMSETSARFYLGCVLLALEWLHERSIIHR
jgi:hypothetical protein